MGVPRRRISRDERDVYNTRAYLRKRMVAHAKSHRGCPTPRGCGCLVDKTLSILERCENELFRVELESYAKTEHGATDSSAESIVAGLDVHGELGSEGRDD